MSTSQLIEQEPKPSWEEWKRMTSKKRNTFK